MKRKNNLKREVQKETGLIRKEWKNLLFNACFAALALLMPILFYNKLYLTSITLLLVSIIGLIKWKSKLTFVIFLFGGLWGPICEMIAIRYGVWNYARPDFFNIPFWLFILWGMAAAFLFETSKEIKKLGVKDN